MRTTLQNPRIIHWRQDEPTQNFGDFLTRLIAAELLGEPKSKADIYRVIGSCIAEWMNWEDLKAVSREHDGRVVYWGCGMRDDAPIPVGALQKFEFYGVRGPLTRDALGLPVGTPLIDTGLIVPLIHAPIVRAETNGRTICIPHINEPRPHDELLAMSGAEKLVLATVDNNFDDLRRILDDIAGADFVLTGSLHGAIVACAYDVPFCFWDTGHIDISFKFRDFSGSVNIPTVFARHVAEGKRAYSSLIEPCLRRPILLPFLQMCPFEVDPVVVQRAILHDQIGSIFDDFFNSIPEAAFRLTERSELSKREDMQLIRRKLIAKISSILSFYE